MPMQPGSPQAKMPPGEDALIRRIQEIERTMREFLPSVALSIKPAMDDIRTQQETLAAQQETLAAQQVTLATAVAGSAETMATLATTVTSLSATQATLATTVANLATAQADIAANVDTLAGHEYQLGNISQWVLSLAERITALENP